MFITQIFGGLIPPVLLSSTPRLYAVLIVINFTYKCKRNTSSDNRKRTDKIIIEITDFILLCYFAIIF